jgi:hypothetical protein
MDDDLDGHDRGVGAQSILQLGCREVGTLSA